MKVLIASTPAMGHVNPLLAIGRILASDGHEIVGFSGTAFRKRFESIGAEYHSLPADADFDLQEAISLIPGLRDMPPGPERRRISIGRCFVDPIPAQYRGLRQVLRECSPDVVISDDRFFGILPMLLGPRSERLPVVICSTSVLHWQIVLQNPG